MCGEQGRRGRYGVRRRSSPGTGGLPRIRTRPCRSDDLTAPLASVARTCEGKKRGTLRWSLFAISVNVSPSGMLTRATVGGHRAPFEDADDRIEVGVLPQDEPTGLERTGMLAPHVELEHRLVRDHAVLFQQLGDPARGRALVDHHRDRRAWRARADRPDGDTTSTRRRRGRRSPTRTRTGWRSASATGRSPA